MRQLPYGKGKPMTTYTHYVAENEDLEIGYDPDATECRDCGIELTMDEVICEKCGAREEALVNA